MKPRKAPEQKTSCRKQTRAQFLIEQLRLKVAGLRADLEFAEMTTCRKK